MGIGWYQYWKWGVGQYWYICEKVNMGHPYRKTAVCNLCAHWKRCACACHWSFPPLLIIIIIIHWNSPSPPRPQPGISDPQPSRSSCAGSACQIHSTSSWWEVSMTDECWGMSFGFQYCTPHSEASVIFISVDAWLQLPHCTICFTPEP